MRLTYGAHGSQCEGQIQYSLLGIEGLPGGGRGCGVSLIVAGIVGSQMGRSNRRIGRNWIRSACLFLGSSQTQPVVRRKRAPGARPTRSAWQRPARERPPLGVSRPMAAKPVAGPPPTARRATAHFATEPFQQEAQSAKLVANPQTAHYHFVLAGSPDGPRAFAAAGAPGGAAGAPPADAPPAARIGG